MYTKWIGSSAFSRRSELQQFPSSVQNHLSKKKKLEGSSKRMNYNTNILITFSGWPEVAQNVKTLLPKVQINFYVYMFSIRLKVVKFNEAG